MLQLGRYNLTSFRLPNLATTRLWLSTFNDNSSAKSISESVPVQGVVKQPVNSSIFQPYDVVVVGGGHAGCEGI
jgi:hypothetical protein